MLNFASTNHLNSEKSIIVFHILYDPDVWHYAVFKLFCFLQLKIMQGEKHAKNQREIPDLAKNQNKANSNTIFFKRMTKTASWYRQEFRIQYRQYRTWLHATSAKNTVYRMLKHIHAKRTSMRPWTIVCTKIKVAYDGFLLHCTICDECKQNLAKRHKFGSRHRRGTRSGVWKRPFPIIRSHSFPNCHELVSKRKSCLDTIFVRISHSAGTSRRTNAGAYERVFRALYRPRTVLSSITYIFTSAMKDFLQVIWYSLKFNDITPQFVVCCSPLWIQKGAWTCEGCISVRGEGGVHEHPVSGLVDGCTWTCPRATGVETTKHEFCAVLIATAVRRYYWIPTQLDGWDRYMIDQTT